LFVEGSCKKTSFEKGGVKVRKKGKHLGVDTLAVVGERPLLVGKAVCPVQKGPEGKGSS